MATQITGLAELNRKFQELDSTLTKKVGARMVSSAATVIKNEAKFIAQSKGLRQTGALINNIVTKRERNAPSGIIQYNVGVRHGREFEKRRKKNKASGNNPYYYKFIELGHRAVGRGLGLENYFKLPLYGRGRKTRISARRRSAGSVRAIPFLAPALEHKQQAAINQMEKILDKELLKANR